MNLYSVTYTLYERNPNAQDPRDEWKSLENWMEDILAGSEETLAVKVAPVAQKKLEECRESGKERRIGVTSALIFSDIDLTTAAQ